MLPIDNYSRSKKTSDGLRSACKECEQAESKANYAKNCERDIARARAWQAAHPEKVREIDRSRNKEARSKWKREWMKKNPEKVKEYSAKSYERLKASGYKSAYDKKWREEINRTAHLAIHRRATAKKLSTPKGVIDHRMNTAIRLALQGGKEYRKWSALVGYTTSELIQRLSETMPTGYSWERIAEMHIDHKTPKSWFKYDSVDDPQFKECWGLANLQLLPAIENIKKSNKMQ